MDLHILPSQQRNGHGQNVIRLIIAEAAASKKSVMLRVLKLNPARALYERIGFVATGENATHVLMQRPFEAKA